MLPYFAGSESSLASVMPIPLILGRLGEALAQAKLMLRPSSIKPYKPDHINLSRIQKCSECRKRQKAERMQ